MPDIFHDLPIDATPQEVFNAVSTPDGLDAWWPIKTTGTPAVGSVYEFDFGPEYQWRAVVTKCVPESEFEIEMTVSDEDWNGTRVGFQLQHNGEATLLRFHHLGWPKANDHYRSSCYCWAMYLRCLKRYVEQGIIVPYADRFDA